MQIRSERQQNSTAKHTELKYIKLNRFTWSKTSTWWHQQQQQHKKPTASHWIVQTTAPCTCLHRAEATDGVWRVLPSVGGGANRVAPTPSTGGRRKLVLEHVRCIVRGAGRVVIGWISRKMKLCDCDGMFCRFNYRKRKCQGDVCVNKRLVRMNERMWWVGTGSQRASWIIPLFTVVCHEKEWRISTA